MTASGVFYGDTVATSMCIEAGCIIVSEMIIDTVIRSFAFEERQTIDAVARLLDTYTVEAILIACGTMAKITIFIILGRIAIVRVDGVIIIDGTFGDVEIERREVLSKVF